MIFYIPSLDIMYIYIVAYVICKNVCCNISYIFIFRVYHDVLFEGIYASSYE